MRAGDLVRSLRKAGGLSQSALARKIGASQARISEIEAGAGTQGPTWSVMERIFTACGARVIVEPGQPEQFVTIDSVVEWREPASNVAKSMAEDMSAASEGSEEIMAGTVEETFER
ncbi:MAG TPA: helix-turn-helix transcriptional regulator [Stellaceae bacterium]|nr:helix-turn-helix transcriptional regulator [Stellaceae bacterium]